MCRRSWVVPAAGSHCLCGRRGSNEAASILARMVDVPLADFGRVGRKPFFVTVRLVSSALSNRRGALRLLLAAYPASAVEEFAAPACRLVGVEGRTIAPCPPSPGALVATEAA